MLERKINNQLQIWKSNPYRKPLILQGARQVGKSFAVQKFAQQQNIILHNLNFQAQKKAISIFDGDISASDCIQKIEYFLQKKINIENDILFLDEIQDAPYALNALKFFCEEMPELSVIAAGSYLGIMKQEVSFPVGKVEYLSMTPLSFEEFLQAVKPSLYEIYQNLPLLQVVDSLYHDDLLEIFYLYLTIGGMPEIVQMYINLGNKPHFEILEQVRKKQKDLCESYQSDFSKHSGVINASHILNVYQAVATQLSASYDEEVSKFSFSHVIPNQKGFDRIINPLTRLTKSRLLIKNYITSSIEAPLRANIQQNRFKVFYHDVGLLNAQLESPIVALVHALNLGYYKGYIVENFVAQELYHRFGGDLFSRESGQSQIEFLVNYDSNTIPLEVKSSHKSRKAKSLDSYVAKYTPHIAYKLSSQNYGNTARGYTTIPLYMIGKLFGSQFLY